MSSNFTNWIYGSNDAEPQQPPTQSDSDEIYFADYDAADTCGGTVPPPYVPGPEPKAENGGTAPEAEEHTHQAPAPESDTKPDPAAAQISQQLDDLFAKVEEFQRIIVSQNRMIERYNDDIVARMQSPLLLQIIQYVDTIQNMLRNADDLEDRGDSPETLYSELKNDIEKFQQLVLADLENYGIHQYQDTLDSPTAYTRRQEVIDREVSCNANEFLRYGEDTTTFYRTELPGYFMVVPDRDGKNGGEPSEAILRREQVIKIIYKPSEV